MTLERCYQGYHHINLAITELNNWVLTAEVVRFCNLAHNEVWIEQELERVLKCKHDIGMAQEQCIIHLEQANTLACIENLEEEGPVFIQQAMHQIRKD